MSGSDISHCGCLLPDGWWGSDGFHWKRADALFLYERARKIFREERQKRGMPDLAIISEWDAWVKLEIDAGRMVNGLHDLWKPSLGAIFAMARCPPYMEVYRRSLEAERRARAQEKRPARVLGDE